MSKDISKLLRDIGNKEISISNVISYLNTSKEKDIVVAAEDLNNVVTQLKITLDNQKRIQKLYNDLLKSFSYKLGNILTSTSANIVSYADATEACNFYTVEWFSNLRMDVESKIQIAQCLIHSISRYTNRENLFWKNIVNRDADTINSIMYSGNEGNINE